MALLIIPSSSKLDWTTEDKREIVEELTQIIEQMKVQRRETGG